MMDNIEEIESEKGAQSVDRALKLLSMVAAGPVNGISIASVVATTGFARPTAHRLLQALIRARLIVQDPDTRYYSLGSEANFIGMMASRRFNLLDVALDSVHFLSDQSGDTSFLSILRGTSSVCVHREDGRFPIRTQALQAGDRHPLGIGAGAMAMLAAMEDDEIEAVISRHAEECKQKYPAYKPNVIRDHVAQTRIRGWSLNPGLQLANSWAIGAVIRSPANGILGALSISAIDSRMGPERQQELGALLLRETAKIEERLVSAPLWPASRAARGRPRKNPGKTA